MADKKSDEEEDDEEGGGGKAKFIVIGLVVLGAVYNFVLKPAPPAEDMAAAEMVEVEIIEGEIFQLEELVLNLEDESVGYLRVGLAVVLEEGILSADFELESAIAVDVAISYLSAQDAADLRSAKGKVAIKEELSLLMREAYNDEKVIRVLFTGLVMQ